LCECRFFKAARAKNILDLTQAELLQAGRNDMEMNFSAYDGGS
jgi:hypothetical protein